MTTSDLGAIGPRPVPTDWREFLDEGEPILWQGRPGFGLDFTLGHALRLLRSAVMLGLFAYLVQRTGYSIARSRDVQAIVLLVFFLPVPLDLVRSMITRRMQHYALTPQRALILTNLGPFGQSLRSVPITPSSPVTLLRGAHSSILFTQRPCWYTGLITPAPTAGFQRLGEVDTVFALIRQTQKGAP